MTPILANKLALIATLAEEQVENARMNHPNRIDRDLESALDDPDVQQFLIEKRRINAVRTKRLPVRIHGR